MKKLILTFALSLVSLLSFSQLTLNYDGDKTGSILATVDTTNVIYLLPTQTIVLRENDQNPIGWFINNINQYPSGNRDTLQFNKPVGEYVVRMGSGAAGGLYAIKIIVSSDPTALTNENTLTREQLKVYPSPSNSDIKISFSADNVEMALNIFSLNGQLLYQDNTNREVGQLNVIELNVSGYQQGIYFVKVGDETVKFVR